MSIAFINAQSDFTFANSTVTVTKPTGVAVGSLLVWHVCNDAVAVIPATMDIDTPAGWTLVKKGSVYGISNGVSRGLVLATFVRVADASDVSATNYTCTGTQSGTFAFGAPGMAAIMAAYSGVDNTTPVADSSVNSGSNLGTGVITATGVTATGAGSYLVGSINSWETDRGPLGTLTSRAGAGDGFTACDGGPVGAGATGNLTCTSTNTETWVTTLLVLNVASGGGGPSTDQVPLQIDTPPIRRTVGRRFDTIAPVGTRMVTSLPSIGWGPSILQPVRGRPAGLLSNRPVDSQPVGTRMTTALSSIGWLNVDLPRDTPLVARPVSEMAPVGVLISVALTSLGWLVVDTSSPRPAPRLVYSELGLATQATTALPAVGPWVNATQSPAAPVKRPLVFPSQPDAPLRPFVSPSVGWMSSDLPRPIVYPAERPLPVDPISPFVFLTASTGWMGAFDVPRSPVAVRRVDVSQPDGGLLPPVLLSLGWLTADLSRAPAPTPSRPLPTDPFVGLSVVGASMGWLSFDLNARAPSPRTVDSSAPVGTQFAPFLPSLSWLATDQPRTPYRTQSSVPVDPVGALLVTPPLANQSWLYATPDPRTPYRTQRAVVVDPVGIAFPFLPAFGPHWYSESRRPAPPTPAVLRAVDPPPAFQATALSTLGWMVVDGRVVARPIASRPAPTDAHLSALLFGGAPWGDVPITRVARQNRPVFASFDPFAPLAQSSFGWHAIEARGSRTPTGSRVLAIDPFTPLTTTPLSSLGWQVVERGGRRTAAVVSPLMVDSPAPFAQPFSGLPWVTVEPVRARSSVRGVASVEPVGPLYPPSSMGWLAGEGVARVRTRVVSVSSVEPVGPFYPPPVLPSLAWLTTELPGRFVARVIRPEPSVVYGAVRVVVLPPLVPDGEAFTWHVPDESLVSVVQFDYRRRK